MLAIYGCVKTTPKNGGKNGIPGMVANLLKLSWNLNLQKERKLLGVDDSKVQTKDNRSCLGKSPKGHSMRQRHGGQWH